MTKREHILSNLSNDDLGYIFAIFCLNFEECGYCPFVYIGCPYNSDGSMWADFLDQTHYSNKLGE